MTQHDYIALDDFDLYSQLDNALETIAALADVIGSTRTDELHEESISYISALIIRMTRDAVGRLGELQKRRATA